MKCERGEGLKDVDKTICCKTCHSADLYTKCPTIISLSYSWYHL